LRHDASKSDEEVARRDPGRSNALKLIVGRWELAPAGLLMGLGRRTVVMACLHFALREVVHWFDRRVVGAVADAGGRAEDCAVQGQAVVAAVVLAVAVAEEPLAL